MKTALLAQRHDPGFSLLELLVVVTIIMVLLALLFPAAVNVRAEAKDMDCRANLKAIGQSMLLFANDHETFLPGVGPRHAPRNAKYNQPWMREAFVGREVFADGDLIFHNWHGGKVGQLAPYLGVGDPATGRYSPEEAKKIYRCPELLAGPIKPRTRVSRYSNGSIDYSFFQFMSGSRVSQLAKNGQVRMGGSFAAVDTPAPLVVEENPAYWINFGPYTEPQHGNGDQMSSSHQGASNYLTTDFSVIQFRLSDHLDTGNQLINQPSALHWWIQKPSGKWFSMRSGVFGSYNDAN